MDILIAAAAIAGIIGLIYTIWSRRRPQPVRVVDQAGSAEAQLRTSVMPVVQVQFYRAPDKVFVKNMGRGAASRVVLQGFWFPYGQGKWRCTFRPVTMLHPGNDRALWADIESETGQTSLDPGDVFDVALRNVWRGWETTLALHLFVEDVLGNCYRSEVRVDRTQFHIFRDAQLDKREYPPEMGRPALVKDCPDAPALVDTTTPSAE